MSAPSVMSIVVAWPASTSSIASLTTSYTRRWSPRLPVAPMTSRGACARGSRPSSTRDLLGAVAPPCWRRAWPEGVAARRARRKRVGLAARAIDGPSAASLHFEERARQDMLAARACCRRRGGGGGHVTRRGHRGDRARRAREVAGASRALAGRRRFSRDALASRRARASARAAQRLLEPARSAPEMRARHVALRRKSARAARRLPPTASGARRAVNGPLAPPRSQLALLQLRPSLSRRGAPIVGDARAEHGNLGARARADLGKAGPRLDDEPRRASSRARASDWSTRERASSRMRCRTSSPGVALAWLGARRERSRRRVAGRSAPRPSCAARGRGLRRRASRSLPSSRSSTRCPTPSSAAAARSGETAAVAALRNVGARAPDARVGASPGRRRRTAARVPRHRVPARMTLGAHRASRPTPVHCAKILTSDVPRRNATALSTPPCQGAHARA